MKVINEILEPSNSASDSSVHELTPSVTLSEAAGILRALGSEQAVLLLSAPGVGKSDVVRAVAAEANLPCRSLLGTQIAPEDVSGIPRIVGERAVFCPPRVLLPEDDAPFCLFLDELPAAAPDVQKAFYSLLLERRLGEHCLPKGSWVVAAGNRVEDNALVRIPSSALVNRVVVLNVRADTTEWLAWATRNDVRGEILAFIACSSDALCRAPSDDGKPFSTPRAWTSLSRALDRVERAGALTPAIARALAFGLVSAEDAAVFSAVRAEQPIFPLAEYIEHPALLPDDGAGRWVILGAIRNAILHRTLKASGDDLERFLDWLPPEQQMSVLVGLVDAWRRQGVERTLDNVVARVRRAQ